MSRSQIRSNQMITTFGPGAMVDLPDHSIIVAGLEKWIYEQGRPQIVEEPRLAAKLARLLPNICPGFGGMSVELRTPPPAAEMIFQKGVTTPGVTGFIFPHWFIVQNVELSPEKYRRRKLVMRGQLESSGKYKENGKNYSVVPVRFVRACRKGHVGDIQWREYAHKGQTNCQQDLSMEERGTTGDLRDVWIICECGAARTMSDAADEGNLGRCNGSRPWLDDVLGTCNEVNRLLLRTASNAYFPQTLPVISIPNSMSKVEQAVLELWETRLCRIKSLDQLRQLKDFSPDLDKKFDETADEDVFSVIKKIHEGNATSAVAKPVKEVEFDALTRAPEENLTDEPDGDFFAREIDRKEWVGSKADKKVEKIVLVHRLREVVALLGFTRFEPETTDVTGELDMNVERAPIVRAPKWMPVAENRGEGIFIQFRPDAIAQWLEQDAVRNREEELQHSFEQWQREHPSASGQTQMPPMPYIMLHSLSHLLISALSLECGYPLSSIRERVYAPDRSGEMRDRYGILIFTASPGAEGTLGGLVHSARDIRKHLDQALHLGALCSNDPVCSSSGMQRRGMDRISGSACHGCLYIAETSCERFNQYLDRTLVVPTIEQQGAEFFQI